MKKVLFSLFLILSISVHSQNKQIIDQLTLGSGKTIIVFSDKTWEYMKEKTQAYTKGKNQKAFSRVGNSSRNIPTAGNDSTKRENNSGVTRRPLGKFSEF